MLAPGWQENPKGFEDLWYLSEKYCLSVCLAQRSCAKQTLKTILG
jgi:hypothetical protein